MNPAATTLLLHNTLPFSLLTQTDVFSGNGRRLSFPLRRRRGGCRARAQVAPETSPAPQGLTPHAAALLVECATVRHPAGPGTLLQVLAAPAARGRHTALGGKGRVVRGRPPNPQVLLRQPAVAQGLAARAAHGGGEGHGALQGAVLTAGHDCNTQTHTPLSARSRLAENTRSDPDRKQARLALHWPPEASTAKNTLAIFRGEGIFFPLSIQ